MRLHQGIIQLIRQPNPWHNFIYRALSNQDGWLFVKATYPSLWMHYPEVLILLREQVWIGLISSQSVSPWIVNLRLPVLDYQFSFHHLSFYCFRRQ